MAKLPTPEQQIRDNARKIIFEIRWWLSVRDEGCNDPFWEDGCNMNLIVNHIKYYKHEIRQLCKEHRLNLPDEYYLPTPPEVDPHYMASTTSDTAKRRLKNITFGYKHYRIVTKKPMYDVNQTSML